MAGNGSSTFEFQAHLHHEHGGTAPYGQLYGELASGRILSSS